MDFRKDASHHLVREFVSRPLPDLKTELARIALQPFCCETRELDLWKVYSSGIRSLLHESFAQLV